MNMIRQDSNKLGAVKSRLCVRITNSRVIVSVVKAYIDGDRVVAYADSTELKNYGVEFGLTNYFAAYATGFLCARRALAANGLDSVYQPTTEAGEFALTEDIEGERRAYKVFLDIGLAKASKGANVFSALKGASDAGLQIPHSESRFFGYTKEKGLDAAQLRDRIFMKSLVEYMKTLKNEDEEAYNRQFSNYIKLEISPESIEGRLTACLEKIKLSPLKATKPSKPSVSHYKSKVVKLTLEQKKQNIAAKLAAATDRKSVV